MCLMRHAIQNAPDGATHIDGDGDYYKFIEEDNRDDGRYQFWAISRQGWYNCDVSDNLRLLSDIEKILELEVLVNRLEIENGGLKCGDRPA